MFHLNSQLDGTLSRDRGGLGISLTAIKPIVEIHGGMVTVQSEGPSQGCEFIVRLPLITPGSADDPLPADQIASPDKARAPRGKRTGNA